MSESADVILDALRPVVDGLAESLGTSAEVVLHDYREPARSVVAVGGDVTGRRVGDAMSEIGLRVLAAGEAAESEINYVTRSPDGRVLKSSTFPIRDDAGALIGALCVNIDVTDLIRASHVISEMTGLTPKAERPPTTNFSGGLEELIDSVVDRIERGGTRPLDLLTPSERRAVLISMKSAGVFALRGAPGRVAERLGISRAALYKDLATIAEGTPDHARAD